MKPGLVFALASLGGCVFDVELGDGAPAPVPRIPDCVVVTPDSPLDFGAHVVGRPVFRTLQVRNCVNAARPLVVSLDGDDAVWAVFADEAEVPAGNAVGVTVQFIAAEETQSAATIRVRFLDEETPVLVRGAGRAGLGVMPRVDCSGDARIVQTGIVLGPETDPLHPETALAVHGIGADQCFEVLGDVVVLGTSLVNLDVLGGLRRVGGTLSIGHALGGNLALQEVDALANLVNVDGDVVVLDNPALRTIDGLLNLRRVGGSLSVQGNRALLDVEGLHSVDTVEGDVAIERNARLRNVHGLRLLDGISGDLSITGNVSLSDVRGLGALASVEGAVSIAFNDRLKSLEGLAGLVEVGTYLGIQGNAALESLDGLGGVTTAREVVIAQNAALKTLDGLGSLTEATLLVVSDHGALTSTAGLRSLARVRGNLIISGNAVLSELGLDALTGVQNLLIIQDNPRLSTSEAEALADRIGASSDIRNNGVP